MVSQSSVHGINLSQKQPAGSTTQCDGCILGKMHRLPFPPGRHRASTIGQLIHTDLVGPMQVSTPGGSRYVVVFKDDYSGWCVTRFLKNKSEVAKCLQEFVARLKVETGKEVKTVRSDGGGEYFGTDLVEWLAKLGIRHESSAPHSPQQNGKAERTNRTLMEAARSLLHARRLPIELWGEALACATYTLNRSVSSLSEKTPFELWYGDKPNVEHLRVFGSRSFTHIPDANRRKLDAKAQECIFVGYSDTSKAYRNWNPVTRKVIISRDVVIDEKSSVGGLQQSQQEYNFEFPGYEDYHSLPNQNKQSNTVQSQRSCAPEVQSMVIF